MITFKERATQLFEGCTRVKNNKVYETLAKEFNIGKRQAGDRFKSVFGMPVRDAISKNIIPDDNKVIDCLLQSQNYKEFYDLTGINEFKRLTPILERLFHTTNYFKIKCILQSRQRYLIKDYIVTLADNKSFLISQILGDGYVERKNSFKVEHGYKQYDWLKFKVGMFNTMYPKTNGIGHIRKRTSKLGHVSFSYRTGEVLKKQLDGLLDNNYSKLLENFTPFGVMVYFLDDGYLAYSKEYKTLELGFSTIKPDLQLALSKYFKTYGYDFNITKRSVSLFKKQVIIKFIQEFIEPFKSIIPENMHYKLNYEDIVGDL